MFFLCFLFFLFYLLGCFLVGSFFFFILLNCWFMISSNYLFVCLGYFKVYMYEEMFIIFQSSFIFFNSFTITISSTILIFCMLLTYNLIYFYSYFYMFFDLYIIRFQIQLQMFVMTMMFFMMSNDLFSMYVCWEFIGLFSFFLMTYFTSSLTTMKAGFKSLFIGKLGDMFFFIIFSMIVFIFGNFFMNMKMFMLFFSPTIGLLLMPLVMTASTKSTQFSLHIWLPDAMEGPMPVSALMHAATLVIVGIMLLNQFLMLFMLYYTSFLSVLIWFMLILLFFSFSMLNNFDTKSFEVLSPNSKASGSYGSLFYF